jgi:hypothetical protein
MLLQLGEHATHEQGAGFRVGFEMVGHHDGNASPLLGTSHRSAHLLAKHIGRPSRSEAAIEPAITPVHQAKAVDPARCPDEPWRCLWSGLRQGEYPTRRVSLGGIDAY